MKQDWKRQKYLASNNEVSNELDLGDKNRGKKEKKNTRLIQVISSVKVTLNMMGCKNFSTSPSI